MTMFVNFKDSDNNDCTFNIDQIVAIIIPSALNPQILDNFARVWFKEPCTMKVALVHKDVADNLKKLLSINDNVVN